MRITQGTFSFLPDLTDEQIAKQVGYVLAQGWALAIESTDDPHPRNPYWEMWGQPMFDQNDVASGMEAIQACRAAHPNRYIKVSAFDSSNGWETMRLSFIVQRPRDEAGFTVERTEGKGRTQSYALRRARPAAGGNGARR